MYTDPKNHYLNQSNSSVFMASVTLNGDPIDATNTRFEYLSRTYRKFTFSVDLPHPSVLAFLHDDALYHRNKNNPPRTSTFWEELVELSNDLRDIRPEYPENAEALERWHSIMKEFLTKLAAYDREDGMIGTALMTRIRNARAGIQTNQESLEQLLQSFRDFESSKALIFAKKRIMKYKENISTLKTDLNRYMERWWDQERLFNTSIDVNPAVEFVTRWMTDSAQKRLKNIVTNVKHVFTDQKQYMEDSTVVLDNLEVSFENYDTELSKLDVFVEVLKNSEKMRKKRPSVPIVENVTEVNEESGEKESGEKESGEEEEEEEVEEEKPLFLHTVEFRRQRTEPHGDHTILFSSSEREWLLPIAQEKSKIILEIIQWAEYWNIQSLMDVCARYIAVMFRNRTPAQITALFEEESPSPDLEKTLLQYGFWSKDHIKAPPDRF